MEQRLIARFIVRGGVTHLHPDVEAARALAEESHLAGVAAEASDVVVYPLQCEMLVFKSSVQQVAGTLEE